MIGTEPAGVSFERPSSPQDLRAARAGQVRFVDVPPAQFLIVDGTGAPGGESFIEAFGALYPVAYTVHFALKKRGVSAPVGPLEGLFWTDDDDPAGLARPRPPEVASSAVDWAVMHWQLMLAVPEAARDEEIAAAIDAVRRKKSPPALPRLHVERLEEGLSAQVLHVGPYDAEPPTIAALHAAIAAAGLQPRGRHHEIYVSDPNRTPPARLKTVIRQPVEGLRAQDGRGSRPQSPSQLEGSSVMNANRTRWALAVIAVAAELLSFVAWRLWLARHQSRSAEA